MGSGEAIFPAGGGALNRLFGKANCWGPQRLRDILRGHLSAMRSGVCVG